MSRIIPNFNDPVFAKQSIENDRLIFSAYQDAHQAWNDSKKVFAINPSEGNKNLCHATFRRLSKLAVIRRENAAVLKSF